MVSRKITKELVSFLRREIREKKAEYGELYKLKRHALVKKGLPNVPELTVFREPWLAYTILIKSGSEIRFYFFDTHGVLQHGDTYKHEVEMIIHELQKKARRLYHYPIKKKEPGIVDLTKQLDKKFSEVWRQVTNYLAVTKRVRQKRPVIKVSSENFQEIFQSQNVDQYIHIPLHSKEHIGAFIFFSFYYLLPEAIKLNKKVAQSIAWRMLLSYKKVNVFISDETFHQASQLYLLEEWSNYTPKEINHLLSRLCIYYTSCWEDNVLLTLVELCQPALPSVSRKNISKIFCRLAVTTNNPRMFLLASILAFPFNDRCEEFTVEMEDNIKLYSWFINRKIRKIRNFLASPPTMDSKGLHKAIKESIEYLFANIINITSSSQNSFSYSFENLSDLFILLTDARQTFPNGKEVGFPFRETMILPYSKAIVVFSPDRMNENSCINLKYHLLEEKGSHPLFIGNIVI
jgi:hypothetical protein